MNNIACRPVRPEKSNLRTAFQIAGLGKALLIAIHNQSVMNQAVKNLRVGS
jgi:hypothetical protein